MDGLQAHPEHQAWADSLLATQQRNALKAPARPADAEKQLLYNGAENDKLDVVCRDALWHAHRPTDSDLSLYIN